MAIKVGSINVIDDSRNVIIGSGSTNPASPTAGTIWFNTTTGKLVGWTGSIWVDLTTA